MSQKERYFRELLEGERNSIFDWLLLLLMKGLSLPYGLVMRLRALAYSLAVIPSKKLPRPVIAVGNLTVGGTGKTPMVAWLARYFMKQGKRVAVLTRGYGGTLKGEVGVVSDGTTVDLSPAESGDEPYLLATTIPGLIVIVGANRYQAGCLAIERFSPDLFILDDGYQHLALHRDLNLLLLDHRRPFGNGWLLPGGVLREPASASARADLIIYTRSSPGLKQAACATGIPSCCSAHQLAGVKRLGDDSLFPFTELPSGGGMAFAGIADPGAFFAGLTAAGLDIRSSLAFPDHSPYGDEEIAAICRRRDAGRASFLLTTEKDGVKLTPYLERLGKIYTVPLLLSIDEPEKLTGLLDKLFL